MMWDLAGDRASSGCCSPHGRCTPHFARTLHFVRIRTPHFALRTSHSALRTPHSPVMYPFDDEHRRSRRAALSRSMHLCRTRIPQSLTYRFHSPRCRYRTVPMIPPPGSVGVMTTSTSPVETMRLTTSAMVIGQSVGSAPSRHSARSHRSRVQEQRSLGLRGDEAYVLRSQQTSAR